MFKNFSFAELIAAQPFVMTLFMGVLAGFFLFLEGHKVYLAWTAKRFYAFNTPYKLPSKEVLMTVGAISLLLVAQQGLTSVILEWAGVNVSYMGKHFAQALLVGNLIGLGFGRTHVVHREALALAALYRASQAKAATTEPRGG